LVAEKKLKKAIPIFKDLEEQVDDFGDYPLVTVLRTGEVLAGERFVVGSLKPGLGFP